MVNKPALFILLLAFGVSLNAQFVTKKEIRLPEKKSKKQIVIENEKDFTGVVFKTARNNSFAGIYVIAGKDTFQATAGCDQDMYSDSIFSHLIVFPSQCSRFTLITDNTEKKITFFLIHTGTFDEETVKGKKHVPSISPCDETEMIEQQQWRAGLPEPDYTRSIHTVHNIIVHHSAGSNTATNYTDVVRSIYIYHTEVRGWSDIGYNYLIASDGTMYKGRDPGIYEQDNVKGAHFCGSNTGTMGICVMGTFTDTEPATGAIESLEDILAWKINKDGLDALGTYPHPLNSELNVIAGHRDGCATECPGQVLYDMLPGIRQDVNSLIIECNKPLPEEFAVTPNPFTYGFTIQSPDTLVKYEIYDFSGRLIAENTLPAENEHQLSSSFLKSGVYFLKVYTYKGISTRKIECIK